MILHPHLGIGEIILGSSRARIASLLGEPCERKLESFSDTTTIEYFMYDQRDLSLGFDSEDGE